MFDNTKPASKGFGSQLTITFLDEPRLETNVMLHFPLIRLQVTSCDFSAYACEEKSSEVIVLVISRVRYGTWKERILPILEISGWETVELGARTYMVNSSIGYRFEYRYYGKSAPVWVGTLEVIE